MSHAKSVDILPSINIKNFTSLTKITHQLCTFYHHSITSFHFDSFIISTSKYGSSSMVLAEYSESQQQLQNTTKKKKTHFRMYLNGKDKPKQPIVHHSMKYCAYIIMLQKHVSEITHTFTEKSHQLRVNDFFINKPW
jgi:hypothetical protein